MSNATAGRDATVEVSTDGGSTYNSVGEVNEVSLSGGTEGIEVSNFDDGREVQRIVGNRDKSMSISGNYIGGDAGQAAIRDAEESGSTVKIRFRPVGSGSGDEQFVADCIITDFSITAAQDDRNTFSIDLDQASGWTRSTQ